MPRLIGRNLSLFAVDQGSGTSDFIGVVRECQVEIEFTTQENTALLDTVEYNEPLRERWRVTFRTAQDAHPALWAMVGETVHFSFTTGPSGGVGTIVSNKTGLLRMGSLNIPDGLQEISWEIVSQGVSLKDAMLATS